MSVQTQSLQPGSARRLPSGLEDAFGVAASELGFCSAAWLFVRELAALGGEPLVRTLRDDLGRTFPVLDTVCVKWLEGERTPVVDTEPVLAACSGADTVLVVGIEADFLDALLPRLASRKIVLLRYSSAGDIDWERVRANLPSNVGSTDLSGFQRYAGIRTTILTLVYGADAHAAHVLPAWARLMGEDVRGQFRSFIGWDVLRSPMDVYPRWLVEVPSRGFTVLV